MDAKELILEIEKIEALLESSSKEKLKYHELKNMVLHDSYILGDGLGIHIPEDTKNSYKFIEGSGYRL